MFKGKRENLQENVDELAYRKQESEREIQELENRYIEEIKCIEEMECLEVEKTKWILNRIKLIILFLLILALVIGLYYLVKHFWI